MELFRKDEWRVLYLILCFAVLGLLSALSWIVWGVYTLVH